jgi:hypothetical protein
LQGKAEFARLVERHCRPVPSTRIDCSHEERREAPDSFYHLKTVYSTAGPVVWRVTDRGERGAVFARLTFFLQGRAKVKSERMHQ